MSLALHYQRVGSGPPLLILHGLFGSGTNWRSIARTLGEEHEVLVPDARNHGASPHAGEMDYPTLAGDALAFMDQHELRQVDLIGHSMGGKTAMCLALAHPERIRRLMVVDIAPAVSGSDHGPLIERLRGLPVERMQRRSEADEALAGHIPEAGLRAFLLQNLASRDGHLEWRIDLAAIARALPSLLDFPDPGPGRRFRAATLFLRGEHSDYISDEHLPIIRTLFPRARVETLAGAGHWLHAEKPSEFVVRARAFLSGHDG